MDHVCNRSTELILDVWLWLPTLVCRIVFQPVVAMLDDLADNAEATIKEQAEQHNLY